jgi:MFS family permease
MSTRRKLLLLASLYLAQGLPFGFFTQALPVLLRQWDVSLEAIGLSSALATPWALKFLWAPLMDRTSTRRGWILGLQATAVLLALVLSTLDPSKRVQAFFAAVLLTNFVAATQDTATDGLAVELLTKHERGYGNGVQVAGYRVGMILGGGALLVVYARVGWTATLVGMAALLALATAPLAMSPDVGTSALSRDARPTSRNPWSWLWQPGALAWCMVLCAYKFGDYLGQGMLRPWMVDVGMSTEEIGVLMGMGGFGAGLLGAVAGGWAVGRLSRRRAVVWFGLLQSCGVAAYATAIAWSVTGLGVWGAVLFEHFVGGMATVALFTAMMDASRTTDASADYTLQASIVVIASGIGSAMSGFGAERLGYDGLYVLATVLSLLGPLCAALPGTMTLVRSRVERPA